MNNPLTARLRYKHQRLISSGVFFGISIPIVFVIGLLPNAGDHRFIIFLVLCSAWSVYVFVAMDRVIWIRCNHCDKDIASNTPWVCGVCQKTHTNATRFPFVGNCPHCGDEPKAYKCHHCGELIFLSKDELKLHFATCANMPVERKPVKKDKDADELAKLDKGIQLKQRQVNKEKLVAELMEIERITKPPKEIPLREILEKELERRMDRNLGAAEIGERLRAVKAKELKDDPVRLARANLTIDEFIADHL
jgi:hypothetical protein